jgi:hypothetical protein
MQVTRHAIMAIIFAALAIWQFYTYIHCGLAVLNVGGMAFVILTANATIMAHRIARE